MITIEIEKEKFNDLIFNQGVYQSVLAFKTGTSIDKEIHKMAKSYVDLVQMLRESQVKDEK